MNPSNANHNNANSKGNQEVLITEIHRQRSNDEMNTTADKDCDHASDDPSSVIGASLLPFLPPGRNEIRRSDRTDDATAHEFHSRSPKRRRDLEGNRQDHFHMEEDGDRNHGYVSPLLHGGVSTMGRNIPQQGNQQPPRQRRARTRLLLRGPPGSGKTSLAMNLAYTEAKKDSHLPSGCTSAIVYRPGPSEDSGSTIADSNRFPLFCRPLPKYFATESQTNTDKSRSNTVEGPNTVPIEKENQQEESWDPYTLSRIRICRVSSLRQLLEDILVLAGKPIEEQPTRAIIIEDLDAIIELEENTSSTPRNQIGNRTGKNTKNNRIVAAMLKTGKSANSIVIRMRRKRSENLKMSWFFFAFLFRDRWYSCHCCRHSTSGKAGSTRVPILPTVSAFVSHPYDDQYSIAATKESIDELIAP